MMKYTLVASSQSRATEVYQGEDKTLIEVYYFKSGTVEARPIEAIPDNLTVRYKDGDVWETEPITESVRFPADR